MWGSSVGPGAFYPPNGVGGHREGGCCPNAKIKWRAKTVAETPLLWGEGPGDGVVSTRNYYTLPYPPPVAGRGTSVSLGSSAASFLFGQQPLKPCPPINAARLFDKGAAVIRKFFDSEFELGLGGHLEYFIHPLPLSTRPLRAGTLRDRPREFP